MSLAAITWAFKQDLAPTKKMVLIALADHCDDDGKCWPGLKLVAKKANVTKRTLQRVMVELENDGILRVEERRRENNSQQSNLYFLLMGGCQIVTGGVSPMSPLEPSIEVNRKKATTIPNDFTLTPETIAFCTKNRPDVNLETFQLQFIESCNAKGYEYVQWQRAFRTWVLKEKGPNNVKFFKPKNPTHDEIFNAFDEAIRLSKAVGAGAS